MSTSSGRSLRSGTLRQRLIVTAILLAIIAAVGFSAKPAYRAFRNYRIDKNLESAREALRIQNWTLARDKARSVLYVRDDQEAFLIFFEAVVETGEPVAFLAAREVIRNPKIGKEEKLKAIRALATQAPQAEAIKAFRYLDSSPAWADSRAELIAAMAPFSLARGEAAVLEAGLRKVMGSDPRPAVRLALIQAIHEAPTPARVVEARKHFGALLANHSEEGLAALVALGGMPGGLAPGQEFPSDLPGWVSQQKAAETIHHLLALHPAIAVAGDDSTHIFQEAITRFSKVDPGALGTWLILHKHEQQALDILKEPAKTRSDAYLALLHALLRLNREPELREALAQPPETADMVELEIVRAVLAARRGDTAAAGIAWTNALNEASYDTRRNRFILVAKTAEKYGARDAAENAWVAAIRSSWGPLPFYADIQPLLSSLASKGRSSDVHAICRNLARFEDTNPVLLNNYLYLSLIHNMVAPADAVATLTRLTKEYPEFTQLNSSLMLAEMMDHRPQDAVARVPALRETKGLSPMMKDLLEGTALVLNDDFEHGKALIEKVNWKAFLPQEQVAFKALLLDKTEEAEAKNFQISLPEASETQESDPEQTPAWRRAVERMEQDRSKDTLPALPNDRLTQNRQ
ncbi:MAG: hypothetical protein EOP84_09955 [Verrucomicrobiaceae bacterium]|nr:MAG: hypothetical protein EOP84_09955 [Verrucomicrobiaceae bacterium]